MERPDNHTDKGFATDIEDTEIDDDNDDDDDDDNKSKKKYQ